MSIEYKDIINLIRECRRSGVKMYKDTSVNFEFESKEDKVNTKEVDKVESTYVDDSDAIKKELEAQRELLRQENLMITDPLAYQEEFLRKG